MDPNILKWIERPPEKTKDEKEPTENAEMHFALLETPLTRNHLNNFFQVFAQSLPLSRRKALSFTNERPEDYFVRSFLRHNGDFQLKRRVQVAIYTLIAKKLRKSFSVICDACESSQTLRHFVSRPSVQME